MMVEASSILAHMTVVDARGNPVGTVAGIEGGEEIKLTKSDSADGIHHYIPLDWVESVDDRVHLSKTNAEVLRRLQ